MSFSCYSKNIALMWGEFEEDTEKERGICCQPNPVPEKVQESHENETAESITTEDDTFALPLRDRLVHFMAASNIEVKSQQRYEPDFTYEERKEIIEKLLEEKPGQFLYRYL